MILKPDSCKSCYGWRWGCDGYVPADGTGDNGCLVVLEAAGEDEAAAGIPTVGRAGQFLWNKLHAVGIEREGFRIHNVLSCRPPKNLLSKMPYEAQVIQTCAPLLDLTIQQHVDHCKVVNRTPVMVALGRIAFKRLMGVSERDPIMKKDYIAYPFWSQRYQSWIISAYHPSFLMQGNQHLTPILTYVFQRALEIAEHGITIDNLENAYLEDPEPATFESWVEDYFRAYTRNPETYLSYDIETPYKEGKDEATVAVADDITPILRCSFAFQPGQAVSIPWKAHYYPSLAKLFASPGPKVGWNSNQFDTPKIQEYFSIAGDNIDAMLAWHVLNSSFPKGLGFVTPFYAQRMSMWKHLDKERPAFYNACDADAALRNWLGIKEDLFKNNLHDVFQRHVIDVHRVFSYMSKQGVLLDQQLRRESEIKLQTMLDSIESSMEAAIPLEARRLKVYKKTPKEIKEINIGANGLEGPDWQQARLKREAEKLGFVQVAGKAKVTQCPKCGLTGVKAGHFKSVGAKKLKICSVCKKAQKQHCDLDEPGLDHAEDCGLLHHEFKGARENPCAGLKPVKVEISTNLWAKPLEWKVSKLGLGNYQSAVKHTSIYDKRKQRVTYDESAMMRLMKKYPNDQLYPLILEHREKQKLLSTYIGVTLPNGTIRGGMPVGSDGKIHCHFTSNPSTLRSACQNPNLQNLPRPTNDLAAIIRNLIVASPGNILYARDFSGIEAVLVGYDAAAPSYIRLARRDVHTYYTAYALYELEPGRIPANDLPLLSWGDEKLFARLSELKSVLKKERNSLYKHLVHAANYMQSAKGAKEKIYSETGVDFDVARVQRVMDIYFELFPEIRQWHTNVLLQAEKDGYLRNAFGYLHRFSHVFDYEKVNGKWIKTPSHDVANKVIAFGPQSNAAGIIKLAMLQLYENHFELVGQYLRLLIHDELLFDAPESQLDIVDQICQTVMESDIKQLPLPKAYGLGDYLTILTEAKKGHRWAGMK